jgi:N-acetyl-gamma-glutamyl-phosphate reductase
MRGASSQAVVNANIMMALDESAGIPNIAYVP